MTSFPVFHGPFGDLTEPCRCFGHTNYSSKQMASGTLVCSNQLGYFMGAGHEPDAEKFHPRFTLVVPEQGDATIVVE